MLTAIDQFAYGYLKDICEWSGSALCRVQEALSLLPASTRLVGSPFLQRTRSEDQVTVYLQRLAGSLWPREKVTIQFYPSTQFSYIVSHYGMHTTRVDVRSYYASKSDMVALWCLPQNIVVGRSWPGDFFLLAGSTMPSYIPYLEPYGLSGVHQFLRMRKEGKIHRRTRLIVPSDMAPEDVAVIEHIAREKVLRANTSMDASALTDRSHW